MSKIKLVVITGPTATGKTKLGIELARKFNGEIISADSMQIYRSMDIGTAKPNKDELAIVRHHMIDIVEPEESFSAALYAEKAAACAQDIAERGKLPIIVGGTGFYIDSLLSSRSFAEKGNEKLRAQLEEDYERVGGKAMLERLSQFDSERAAMLHENDKKRVVRSLEIVLTTGKSVSQYNEEINLQNRRFDYVKIALSYKDRQMLYSGINSRVDEMFEQGLVTEVETLLSRGVCPEKHTSMQAIGYKELVCALRGEISIEQARELIKQSTRRYAKRQLTWLRRDDNVKWINWEKNPEIKKGCQISTIFLTENGIIVP